MTDRIERRKRGAQYLVSMSEPDGSLLLAADERDPITAVAAQAFPGIGVAVHPTRLEWTRKGLAGRRTDAVGETLVIPVG